MVTKTITYETLDGEEITDTFLFNLSKAELVELEVSTPGGLAEHLKRISASEDGKQIIAAFKDILRRSYGKRSEDGKRFVKKDEWWDEFESTEAYSQIFMELVTDAGKAAEFVNGIVPQNLEAEVARIQKQQDGAIASVPETALPEARVITRAEMVEMDKDELQSGLAAGRYRLE